MTVALDSDTRRFVRQQSGGMYAVRDAAVTPGRVFWVGSNVTGATDSTGYGQSPGTPFATLVYAETQCLSARGDTIYVLPSHSEVLTHATGAAVLTLDVTNLSIIGLGGRSTRPSLLIEGHANNYINITGADTLIENIAFKANVDDIAKCIAAAADGIAIRNCAFLEYVTTHNFVTCINDGGANTADQLLVEGCEFIQPDTANTHAIEFGAGQDRVVIRNNFFSGFWETMCIGGAGVLTNILVENNYIQNIDTDADQCIKIADTSTGGVVRNLVGSYVAGDATTNINAGSKMMLCENYSVDGTAGDVQGVLDPAAT